MIAFTTRRLERTKTLGERLKKVREESRLTLDDAEAATGIRRKYLEALEQGRYAALPGPVYIENFLKKYASFLEVSEEFVLDVYRHQERRVVKQDTRPHFTQKKPQVPRSIVTPTVIRILLIVSVVLICLGYVAYEVVNIFSPPDLVVSSPVDSITVTTDAIAVVGVTDPEITVIINGQQVFLDQTGRFSEMVSLKEGLNVITVAASKKRSKQTIVTRRVLYEKSTEATNNN